MEPEHIYETMMKHSYRHLLQEKISVYTQPPNSPDLNINDLGFFRAVQAAYDRFSPKNENEVIEFVHKAYDDYDYKKINKVWLSLMMVMNKVLQHHGRNEYSMTYMGKDQLDHNSFLPLTIAITEDINPYL